MVLGQTELVTIEQQDAIIQAALDRVGIEDAEWSGGSRGRVLLRIGTPPHHADTSLFISQLSVDYAESEIRSMSRWISEGKP